MYRASYVQCTCTHAAYRNYACDLIGKMCAREAHTSELNKGISLIYIMYCTLYIQVHAYAHHVRTLCTWSNWEHAFIVRVYSCFAACSGRVFWRLSEELYNETERDRAMHSTQTADAWICINILFTLQICSIYVTTMLPINTQYNSLTLYPQCTEFV